MSRTISVSVLLLLLTASVAMATSEPPQERNEKCGLEPGLVNQVQTATRSFIEAQMVDGVYLYYDASMGEVRRLELKMLHPLVGKEGELYVARADFFDDEGRPVEMKFLVIMQHNQARALQAVAHRIGGNSPMPCADSS